MTAGIHRVLRRADACLPGTLIPGISKEIGRNMV